MSRSFLLLVTLVSVCFISVTAQAQTNVLFIVDASGSMKEKIDGETRMSVAKDVLETTLKTLPTEANLGLLVYGHRKARDCSDLELVAPMGSESAATLGKIIADLNAIGETPIAEALIMAAKSFKILKGQQNKIILVTDGLEECKGDPCAAAQSLKDSGLDVAVNIVGFTLDDEKAKALQCVTDITGGKYYSAANAAGLTEALQDVQKAVQETVIVQETKEADFNGNLLDKKNGGTLASAPNDVWESLSGKPEDFKGATYGGAGVWSFKDGKAATFDQIEVLITGPNSSNLKDFEVLAGDDLNGSFKSLGEFTALNAKMMPEGWQGFKFPETTAHYVKVIFKAEQGGDYNTYINGNPLKLMGTINEDSEPVAKPAMIEGINLLSQKNGGTLLMGGNDAWGALNDDIEERATTYAGEGVWAFKDEKPATIKAVEMLLPGSNPYNVKEFEVLVGDDGPTGDFRSLGAFSTQNIKVMPEGYQRFIVPETEAKYIKFKLINAHEKHITAYELRVIGTPAP